MKYTAGDGTPSPGYVTLDGVMVPFCQSADDEADVVTFAAVSDDYAPYFDHDADDYVILTRTGKVEFHPHFTEEEWRALVTAGEFQKPFPYEIPTGARPTQPPVRMIAP